MTGPGRRLRHVGRALALGVILGLGCARGPAPGTPAAQRIVLRVQNKHWADINVSLNVDGQRTRLGAVTAASISSFELPSRLIGERRAFRLTADPIGSPTTFTSESVSAGPGQTVEWILEVDLRRSTVSVF